MVDAGQRLLGICTNRDLRFIPVAEWAATKVADVMTTELFTAPASSLIPLPAELPDEAAAQLVAMPFSAVSLLEHLDLARRQPGRHGLVLRHERHAGVDAAVPARVVALDQHASLVDADHAGEGPHQRGLAGAVRSEQSRDPGAERAAEVGERHLRPEPHRDVVDLDGRVDGEGRVGGEGRRRRRQDRRIERRHRSTQR